jgi:ABC-type lipoprotein release transport system permease subunit
MRTLILPLKNAYVKWWRSLTLGVFILIIASCMVLFNSFTRAVTKNSESAVVNSVTGHIQIRSDRCRESDMVAQYNQGWDALDPLPAPTVAVVKKAEEEVIPGAALHELVRQSVSLTRGTQKEDTMLIGLEPDSQNYHKSFTLSAGRYLQPGQSHEVLITEELAGRFSLGIGSRLSAVTKNRYGLNAQTELTVVGIGNFLILSLFSYAGAYTDIDTIRQLIALAPNEATDLVVYADNVPRYDQRAARLVDAIARTGVKAALTKGMRVKTQDLAVQSLAEIKENWETPGGVLVSTYEEMGKVYQGIGSVASAALAVLVGFLFVIVFIMIMNLVFMMGFERFREIGTLRAIGFSRGRILALFLSEISFVAGVCAFLGIASGAALVGLAGKGIQSPFPFLDFLMGKTVTLELNGPYCVLVFLIIVGFAVAASLYPAYKACSLKPAAAIRTV